jgi:hypothetical protein
MKNSKLLSLHLFVIFFSVTALHSNAQCTWKQKLSDGFEYQTACPDLVPGMTVHVIPQNFAVHSGNYSLYMNFVNCNGSTGACPGDTVYKRTLTVCPNVPFQISSWFTTTFSGLQCDIGVAIVDANNTILASNLSFQPPYAPTWFQYQSGSLTATTSTVKFIVITNVGGAPTGNDLSMDDFLMEQCQDLNLGPDTTVCNTFSIVLDAGAGYTSYVWNTGANTQSINTPIGWNGSVGYNVTITNGNGCSFSDTINISFAVCTSIKENAEETNYSVYPNPAADGFEISGLEANRNNEVDIVNALGQIIYSTKSNTPSLKIETADYENGIYFLRVKTSSSVDTIKICIKH